MKINFKIVGLISILLIFLIFITNIHFEKYNNNVLYSEKYVLKEETKELENVNYTTREEAISRGLSVLKDGFGVNLDRDQISETIDLYESEEGYEWYIMWIDNNKEQKYYCNILADNGDIKSIVVEDFNFDEVYKKNYEAININKAKDIMTPLLKSLNLNIDNMSVYLNYSDNYGTVLIVNDKYDNSYLYEIDINYKDEKIIYFRKVENVNSIEILK
ncbi:hypothetical protein [Romboutsia lituseburensis]|uniref:hypothetical protein n=1 Tax=Romboutsia lituseburensis TaxID=1537 RepID=UPI00215A7978|nr:hypothetical protein [Romboutsia lituseburensis]MCR8746981.1 hypothetical protein [Romboutsia lituseburensis]